MSKNKRKGCHFKPVRATGAGLHSETESGSVGQFYDARVINLGIDHTTKSRVPSEKTLLDLICSSTNPPLPAIIRTLAVEHRNENIGESLVVHMLKEGQSEVEVRRVLGLLVQTMKAL